MRRARPGRGVRAALAILPLLALICLSIAAAGAGDRSARQHHLVIPAVARDGALPTPTPTPVRTPYPALLPCGDILVPVDKSHELAPDCEPPDLVVVPPSLAFGYQLLRADAETAFEGMVAAAAREGLQLRTNSGYRSYAIQEAVFQSWVSLLGPEQAERTSAHPGHSEHQLGTTVDLCTSSGCLDSFSETAEAAWVAAHSWEHGFVVSYPDEKEAITGFMPEPWHVRYVGVEVAARVRASGLTLHEFLLR